MGENNKIHHLHIEIPQPLYDEIKEILPEKGQVTFVIKQLLKNYVKDVKQKQKHAYGVLFENETGG